MGETKSGAAPSPARPAQDDPEGVAAWLDSMRRSLDLVLDEEGRWHHDGAPFTNRRISELLDRGIDLHPDTGEAIVRVGAQWCYIGCSDTPFLVRRLSAEGDTLYATLNTRERVTVPPDVRWEHRGGRVLISLADGRRARLDRSAQAALAEWLGEEEGALVVRVGGRRWALVEVT